MRHYSGSERRNPDTGFCALFFSRIKNGNPPLVFENGEQTRDFIHVSDVVRANRLAIESDAENVAVNIESGSLTMITEVAETLIDLYGKSDDLVPEIANDYPEDDIRHCYAYPTAAADELGSEAAVGFEEGMRELVDWGQKQDAEDHFEELEKKGLVGRD